MGLIAKIKGKLAYWKRTILLYGFQPESNESQSNDFEVFSLFSDLVDLQFEFEKEDYEQRFQNGHLFCCLIKDKKMAAYGWVNPNSTHFLGELSLNMQLEKQTEVLYDFYTFPNFRGKGLYPQLLKNINHRNSNPKIIYVLKENKASIRGIEKAGFGFLGQINGWNKKTYLNLLETLWQK